MNKPDNPPSADPSPTSDGATPGNTAPPLPASIDRYRVQRLLGQSSFGRLYLARDHTHDRAVVVKVPHPERVARPEDVAAYLGAASAVLALQHPGILPVIDFGCTDGVCFAVSPFVEGTDLKQKIKQQRLAFLDAAELVESVARALAQAHTQGLLHRNVKPANILIDPVNRPHLADFGLALRAEDFAKAAPGADLPSYMSPELAGGNNQIDGRSDVFSLGVVFREQLTGELPFRGSSPDDLREQISGEVEASPPRQDEYVPEGLASICRKALVKRVSERYTASELATAIQKFRTQTARVTRVGWQGSVTVVSLEGDLNKASTPAIWDQVQQLIPERKKCLVLDFGGVCQMGSSGIACLEALKQSAKHDKSRLVLAAVRPAVRDTLERISGRASFKVEPTVKAALVSFPQS
jgi:anti-anti-sigma factor